MGNLVAYTQPCRANTGKGFHVIHVNRRSGTRMSREHAKSDLKKSTRGEELPNPSRDKIKSNSSTAQKKEGGREKTRRSGVDVPPAV